MAAPKMAAPLQPLTAPLPPTTLMQNGQILFLHPGYPAPTNTLLVLPRVDQIAPETTTGTITFGVHYHTALVGCQIIAGNAFATGRLARDQAGQQLVDMPLDGVLTEDSYYFLVGDGPNKYPVVASFRDWEFPHGRIPDSWPVPSASGPASHCGITNFSGPLERVYLVPQEEGAWFLRNGMGRYPPTSDNTIDTPANILALRRDIHTSFDNRYLTILPKAFPSTPESPQYIVHFLSNDSIAAEYWPTYHNCLVQYLHVYSRPFLFARFAWSIFFHVNLFVTSGIARRVIVRAEGEDGTVKYDEKVIDAAHLTALYGGGESRGSKSSRKSSRTCSMMEEDNDLQESHSEDSDMDDI